LVLARGVPDEMIELANERVADMNEAFAKIRSEREGQVKRS
jgi:DnaJ-domain-containing protein 1